MTFCSKTHGFSLVETAIASIIVGGVLVSSLNAIGAAAASGRRQSDRERAHLLAHDLLAEILLHPYADPETGAQPTMGPELGETTGTRALFDDIDDFHGWTSTPIELADGTAIVGFTSWSRTVTCRRLDPATMETVLGDSEIIEVVVEVEHNGTTLAKATAIRTNTWRIQ